MFKWFDGVLLGAAQKFCDHVQKMTGLTTFTFQKWSLILAAVFLWISAAFLQRPMLTILIAAWTMSAIVTVRNYERQEREFLENGSLEIPRFYTFERRFPLASLLMLFALLAAFEQDFGVQVLCYVEILFVANIYFCACIPLPPSKSTLRKWYEKGLIWINDRLSPEPVGVPVRR